MKRKFEYAEAKKVADEMLSEMQPHCKRIEVAGSVRRKRQEVSDLELLIIPKPYDIGLLKHGLPEALDKYQCIKGKLHPDTCKYTRRLHPSGIEVDIFIANEDNWGYLYAIRTGPAEYSHKVLARRWYRMGYRGKKGNLTKNGQIIPIREEQDLYDLIGLPWLEPTSRDSYLFPTTSPKVAPFI